MGELTGPQNSQNVSQLTKAFYFRVLSTLIQLLSITAVAQLVEQLKRITRKQSTRRQHLSWLKDSAFFSLQKN